MIKINYICDFCSRDLTTNGDKIAYRLKLDYEPIEFIQEFNPDKEIYFGDDPPPLDQVKHFCTTDCLKLWLQ